MARPSPMPPSLIALAAGVIALAAVAGLLGGVLSSKAPHGDGEPTDFTAPQSLVANAKPLTGPVIDESMVRLWAREEAQAALARSAPKKPQNATGDAEGTAAVPAGTSPQPGSAAQPSTASTAAKPVPGQQVPF